MFSEAAREKMMQCYMLPRTVPECVWGVQRLHLMSFEVFREFPECGVSEW